MDFLEKDLEEIIYTSDKELLGERGLYISGRLYRQLKIGNYGIADLVELRRPCAHNAQVSHIMKGLINVIELKKDKVGISAFLQALGYLKGIKRYLQKRGIDAHYNYSITLIGSCVDESSTFIYLPNMLSINTENSIKDEPEFGLYLYEYKYGIDGIRFVDVEECSLINEGF
jgi:hypothetical protein